MMTKLQTWLFRSQYPLPSWNELSSLLCVCIFKSYLWPAVKFHIRLAQKPFPTVQRKPQSTGMEPSTIPLVRSDYIRLLIQ